MFEFYHLTWSLFFVPTKISTILSVQDNRYHMFMQAYIVLVIKIILKRNFVINDL